MSSPEAARVSAQARTNLQLVRIWWMAGWILVLFIAISCLEPPRYVPNLHLWDKLEHALAFFGLTFWFGGLVRRRAYPLLVLWMLLFGAGIEVAQGVMGLGRDADVWDWVADSVGVALAITLVYLGLGSWMFRIEQLLGLARERS
jgi:VanZ family protein